MGSALRVYIRSLKILWSEPILATSLTLAAVFVACIQILEPILFGRVIDALSHGGTGAKILITWASFGLFNVVISVFLAVTADRLAHRQRLGIMGRVFERVIALPFRYHAEQGSGRVVRAILTGTDQLFALWLSFLREHLPSLIGIFVLIPTALSLDYRLTAILFGLSVVYLFANSIILNKTKGRQANVEGFHQDVFGRVGDVIGNVSVVQSYTRLVDESQQLQLMMTRLLNAQYPVLTWWGLLNVITRLAATLSMVAIVGTGSYLVSLGEITVGEVVAFTGFSGLLISKLDQISAFFSRAIAQAPALRNFFELLDKDAGAMDLPGARPMGHTRGEVEFKNVDYTYSQGGPGVHGLNFKVEAGKTIALVGGSGSGKTTTLALLQRLFDPQEGQILLDGHDVREFTVASLREHIAAVFQDPGLFNRSIAENIRVGRPSASDAEVEDAARRAEAHDFIMKKPGAYQFVIGERGLSLSGGERQRIAIARAILKNASILIFDEATSALDNETEKKIQLAINHLREEKTTFIIAHRLSTVVSASLILVFEAGRIIEVGSFDDLKKNKGTFSRLLAAGELAPEKDTNDRPKEPRGETSSQT